MAMNHNQMAYVAIITTLIFGSLFVGISGFWQTNERIGDFESAAEEDIFGEGTESVRPSTPTEMGFRTRLNKPNTGRSSTTRTPTVTACRTAGKSPTA